MIETVRRAGVPAAAALLVLAACGGTDAAPAAGGRTSTATTTAAQRDPLPATEDIAGLGALTTTARPFPDFALAVGDVVWVSGVDPGIVGYDAATGAQRAAIETGHVPVAMEAGHGALWAVEAETGPEAGTLLRIDPTAGAVTARTPVPEPGVPPESSVAVTADATWVLVGSADDPAQRSLAAFDPATGALLRTVPAPEGAKAVRGGFGSLWVSTGQGAVVRVDPADGAERATVPTGAGAGFLTVTEDAVWVLDGIDATAARIDPDTDQVAATVAVSSGPVSGGDIAAGDGSVWVRTTRELAVQVDAATDRVVRVLGPPEGSGSVAVAGGAVWVTAHDTRSVHRVPLV